MESQNRPKLDYLQKIQIYGTWGDSQCMVTLGQYMGQLPVHGDIGAIHVATASAWGHWGNTWGNRKCMVTLGQYMGHQPVYGNTGAIHGASGSVW